MNFCDQLSKKNTPTNVFLFPVNKLGLDLGQSPKLWVNTLFIFFSIRGRDVIYLMLEMSKNLIYIYHDTKNKLSKKIRNEIKVSLEKQFQS